ncbi:MAG: hypothetical protein K8F91_17625, partial [Candidatus Obscuribacterales bacterium]|nr:hypothetical protein [Candidatus Obscuribacterales bacterium]
MHLVEENQFRLKKQKSFIGQSALVLLGIIVLFFTAFTSLSLPTPTLSNFREFSHEKAVQLYGYLPDRYK